MAEILSRIGGAAALGLGLLALAGCDSAAMPGFLKPGTDTAEAGGDEVSRAATGARDVEAPEVFEVREAGLWDGRPSLGGVWVAHPDVTEPERVIIRNEKNGQYVIGALFKRERETPGPRIQVSSDAAAALNMLAGAPVTLHVVALRRVEGPETPAPADEATPTGGEALSAAGEIEAETLDPVAAGAAAALDTPAPAAETETQTAAATPAPEAPAPARAQASALSKPYVQIGIFSIEQNARNTATAMRQEGMVPTVKKQESSGKTFWRVVVGPAQTRDEIDALLAKIKASGFTDAYAVSN
ncbi:SPOR domain-containing protein [Roseivivax sp. GX 12232]|uniref:SPOR domain-containing protein n=1 Tax=Roseivivax sp. GX 12232 TaxID=2900547 RepID=UPI001E285E31|nr:SPOR domain-containing protein [Roseivivax sp. GX 12232]MCE0504137.1 SPOR domain-containing protein [Roseivivax sp. GX 12232]